jgi:flagellar P-ring protein precursor FlgI
MKRTTIHILVLTLFGMGFLVPSAQATRIKDISHIEGVRPNQLIGYGLVVGLDGTGDNKQAEFTVQSVSAMLSRMGVRIDPGSLLLRNVAAVMVTATLPAHTQPGTAMDVLVSAIGNARSIAGGTLILTPLMGVDGKTYAMAQGSVQVGGFGATGKSGSRVKKNHLNAGRVPNGAIVERSISPVVTLNESGQIMLMLKNPDFTTARNVVDTINRSGALLGLEETNKDIIASIVSSGSLGLSVPEIFQKSVPRFISLIEGLEVYTDTIAKVVINSRTGTVVMGENVRISPVAVAHGSLTLTVNENSAVSQPGALSGGNTVVTPGSSLTMVEEASSLQMIEGGATLSEIVEALNALGATPRDMIDILQAVSSSGSLHAELEVH